MNKFTDYLLGGKVEMIKKYEDVLSYGELDINSKRYFSLLNEEEEVLITRELINFCFWTQNNIEWLEKYLQKEKINLKDNNGFINYQILTEFWLQKIGKSIEIEKLLDNASVISDIYDYIEYYYSKLGFLFINSKRDYGMVLKNNYRTENQANRIKELLKKNKNTKEYIELFFQKNEKDVNHIDEKNAQLLIEKFS